VIRIQELYGLSIDLHTTRASLDEVITAADQPRG
jgi:hypothetical protein